MPPPMQITHPKQLIVEGKDAVVFLEALLNHLKLTDIQIQDFGGGGELRGFLKALRNTPGFEPVVTSLGIVRDAETNATATFQSVCGALSNAALATPSQPMIAAGHNPRINVLILPDNTTPGMLETLCLQSVNTDPVMICIDQYFQCVEQQMGSSPGNMEKAKIQAFLASRSRPGLLLGQAAHRGYWPWDSSVFDDLKQFLEAL